MILPKHLIFELNSLFSDLMRNSLIILFTIISICSIQAQDTITVQTLTFDSITTRRGIFEFPTGESFRKILMYHTLKCDIYTQHDQYPCGEWDYLTYNQIHIHTGLYDSTLYHHPNFTLINERSVDSLLITDEPVYNYFRTQHTEVAFEDTLSMEYFEVGGYLDYCTEAIPTDFPAGRSQYLWKAEEMQAEGMTAGPISGIKLNVLEFGWHADDFLVRMTQTGLEELTADTLINGLDTVYHNQVEFDMGWLDLNFMESFEWDGVSNILIDFSFTNTETGAATFLLGEDPGFNCGISSGTNNYAMDLDGETDFIKLPEDTYFNSDFTFECWIYKRNNNNWSRLFDFGNGANQNNVIIALSQSNSGKLSFHINNDNQNRSFQLDDPTPLNEWLHVTLRLTAHIGWVYLNGNYFDIGLLQQPDDVSRSINYIGRSNWANDTYADALIDEFRLFNIALEPEQIKAHYRQELIDPALDTNLIVYFDFNNDNNWQVFDKSENGHNGFAYGYPNWYRTTGPETFLNFHQSNIRPQIHFERLISSNTQLQTHYIIDSAMVSPTQLILFENMSVPTLPTDTIVINKAGYSWVYENWQIVDSVWNEPTEIMYKVEIPYYGEPFEVIENVEIGRFITPYGINLSLGPQGFTWIYDVTDYAHLLQGQVDLSAGNQQELIDLKFEMIKGMPPRDVLQIDRIWGPRKSYYYKDLDDDVVLAPTTIPLLPEASQFKVKTRLTGHGHNSNTGDYPHCCEWKDNTHYLKVNGSEIADWHIFQYHDCGLNPVYPQGGTWPGAREGWCPGDLVTDHEFEITNYISGDEVELDYSITPVPPDNLGMGWGNYVMAMHLIQYGELNFTIDAEIVNVITPNDYEYYLRKNPICSDPSIIIRNNGATNLTSLNIDYGVSGAELQSYFWIGNIEPHLQDTIILPVPGGAFWLGDTLHNFTVSISNPNGLTDEYADNNSYQTHFDVPDLYNEPFVIKLKSNNQPERYSITIKDIFGDVVFSRIEMDPNIIYIDTIDLDEGCYTLELIDLEDMGLSYWAYPEQGSGYMYFYDTEEDNMIKYFNPEFGRNIFYAFNVGDVAKVWENNLEELISIYPNPFEDQITIDLEPIGEEAIVNVFNSVGQMIYNEDLDLSEPHKLLIDLQNQASGLFIVNLAIGTQSISKKLIKK